MTSVELPTLVGTLKQNHIFHVELNRPKQMNAMSRQFFQDLQTIFQNVEILKKVHDIRVVMVTARGKHFSAGLDLKEATGTLQYPDQLDQAKKAILLYDLIKDWQKSMNVMNDCTVPTIVGIHGYCIGGGIDFITSADIRYCTEDANFCIKEVDIGMAADIGTLQRLHIVTSNSSMARELTYTARNFGASDAKELGLVSKICKNTEELHKDIFTLANIIASKSPVGIYTTKSIFRQQMKKLTDDNLDNMARVNAAMILTEDVMIAVKANLMKTKAIFPKL